VNLAQATLSPGTDGHPLGTDASDYDVLRRLMVAAQISLEVGTAAALLATLVGMLRGAIAGYFGVVAHHTAAGPRRGGVGAGPRIRPGDEGDGRQRNQGGHPAHRTARGRDHHGERHVPADAIALVVALSYLGLGIPPPQ
jgi:hypothetical protein